MYVFVCMYVCVCVCVCVCIDISALTHTERRERFDRDQRSSHRTAPRQEQRPNTAPAYTQRHYRNWHPPQCPLLPPPPPPALLPPSPPRPARRPHPEEGERETPKEQHRATHHQHPPESLRPPPLRPFPPLPSLPPLPPPPPGKSAGGRRHVPPGEWRKWRDVWWGLWFRF